MKLNIFHVFICHLYILIGELSVYVFMHFLLDYLCFITVEFWELFIYSGY